MSDRRCPECHSGQWYSKNGPTGAQETCKNPWHEEQRPSKTRVSDAFNKAVDRLGELFSWKQLIREIGGQQAGLERYRLTFSGQTFSEVNELLHDLGVAIRDSTAHEPPAGPYAIEPHGDGHALYSGRDQMHHGFNLARITEATPETLQLIERALNARASEPPPESLCPNCEKDEVGTFTADDWFLYGVEKQFRLVARDVLFFRCMACDLEFTGEDGEQKRLQAVRDHLERAASTKSYDCIGCGEADVPTPHTYCEACHQAHQRIANETRAVCQHLKTVGQMTPEGKVIREQCEDCGVQLSETNGNR